MTKPSPENVPKALDAIVDMVLAYKPKPKSKPAKKRKKKISKMVHAASKDPSGRPNRQAEVMEIIREILAAIATKLHAPIATAYAYASALIDGSAEPFWPHVVLIGGSVLASVSVGAGIIFESADSPAARRIATRLVIAGVAFEALLTICLFAFDEGISSAQQLKIVALEGTTAQALDSATRANNKTADLIEENTELERVLAPREIEQSFLARALTAMPKVPLYLTFFDREEPKETAQHLASAINGIKMENAAPWGVTILPTQPWYPEGISVEYGQSFSLHDDPSAEKVAIAICEALKQQGIGVNTKEIPTGLPFPGSRLWPSSVPLNAVIIAVGAKANHFWLNRALIAKGINPEPERSFCTHEEFSESVGKSPMGPLKRGQANP